jgi:hypothetical protein
LWECFCDNYILIFVVAPFWQTKEIQGCIECEGYYCSEIYWYSRRSTSAIKFGACQLHTSMEHLWDNIPRPCVWICWEIPIGWRCYHCQPILNKGHQGDYYGILCCLCIQNSKRVALLELLASLFFYKHNLDGMIYFTLWFDVLLDKDSSLCHILCISMF